MGMHAVAKITIGAGVLVLLAGIAMLVLAAVSYTHLTLPTNREV